jgi:ubiquinone/menaquinone biosynthesis C-methylase UbiE
MGFYSRHIFPRLMEWSIGSREMGEQRRATLASLQGRVLEIGFGTGLNLDYYPPQATHVTAIDSVRLLPAKVADRIARSHLTVEQIEFDAGKPLPLEDESFDAVVTTFTLCSIADVQAALGEIKRLLKPEADYVFLEHGRSDNPRIARQQELATPITRIIGCGCHMNRRIDSLISDAGLNIKKLERFIMPESPRILGELYRGVARR